MTVKEALEVAGRYLRERGLRMPRQDAEMLLCGALHRDRAYLFAHPERALSRAEADLFQEWLTLRGEHYPLQYLRGIQEFYGREFLTTPAVLIPRPETEVVVQACLDRLGSMSSTPSEALDVGTGSGCIAVTLACESQNLRVTATDISRGALAVAQQNAARHACLDRLEFVEGDGLTPVMERAGGFDLIVSNPPYVRRDDPSVDWAVSRYEPEEAVFAGASGLEMYQKLLRDSGDLLRPGGWLVVELGFDVLDDVAALARELGWRLVELVTDLAGVNRCAVLQRALEA